jgi:hypothetical protein
MSACACCDTGVQIVVATFAVLVELRGPSCSSTFTALVHILLLSTPVCSPSAQRGVRVVAVHAELLPVHAADVSTQLASELLQSTSCRCSRPAFRPCLVARFWVHAVRPWFAVLACPNTGVGRRAQLTPLIHASVIDATNPCFCLSVCHSNHVPGGTRPASRPSIGARCFRSPRHSTSKATFLST